MADGIKYKIEYYDVVNIKHRCHIIIDGYIGEEIFIQGSVRLDYGAVENPLDVIRSQGLRVDLEANSELTFEDLYSEKEKSIEIHYFRDEELYFKGWLNPEGWYEDFVNSDWIVSFDCVDGLGYLSSYSFVDENGIPITGKITQAQALFKALARTGISKNMNVSIGIYYTGLTAGVPILDYVYVVGDRYIKDDAKTIMSCEEVILDILEPYGAILTSFGDNWYIYKPNELYSNSTVVFNKYTLEGVAYQSVALNLLKTIGSDIEGYEIRHCNQNQKFKIEASIGAYRISYKYGLLDKLLQNSDLYSADGVSIDGFQIVNYENVEPLEIGGYGFTFKCVTTQPFSVQNIRSKFVEIDDDVTVNVKMEFSTQDYDGGVVYYPMYILISDVPQQAPFSGGDVYYLQDDFTSWGAANVPTDQIFGSGITDKIAFEFTTPVKPAGITGIGYLHIAFRTPIQNNGYRYLVTLDSLLITPNQKLANDTPVIGEFHTFQRKDNPSSKIQDIKQVATGDNTAGVYKGTIYKSDQTTPTFSWYRKGIAESKKLLRIMGEETMRISQLPTRVYSGDVFGYIEFLSIVEIANVSGRFLIMQYSYDTKNNVTSLVMRQILGAEIPEEDLEYDFENDYGNTVKPTIKG